ncbi:MAG: hypothetical protein ACOY37_03250 [Pseudomonadota bacterium]
MLLRALLVMLVVLNAGVAAWWALREPPQPAPAVEPLPGVPGLELVGPGGATAQAATPRPAACYRYGPFRNPRAFEAARAAIAREVLWTATARELATPPRGWRVVLPQPTREQAVATAARIGSAGFSDYLVLPATGADANTIALGRYGSEAAARDRVQALSAAGFPAVAEPVGAREVLWLDVAAAQGFDPVSGTLGMTGAAIPCAGVLRDGRYTIGAPA